MEKTTFKTGLKWSSLEQLIVQSLILGHQLLLARVLHLREFGYCTALFSIVWLLSTWLNFGFDTSLSPLFHRAVQSHASFWAIIFRPLLLQSLLIIIVPFIAVPIAMIKLGFQIDALIITLLAVAAIAETAKRILRSMLHFAGKFKPLAFLEIATNTSYVLFVWGYYLVVCLLYGTAEPIISMPVLLLPFALVTFVEVFALLFIVHRWHKELPELEPQHTINHKELINTRATGYLHQLASQCLSSNLIVPLVATYFGLRQAGALSLASNISYYITTCVKRTFGITTGTVLAHAKPHDRETKQALISAATSSLYLLLSVVGCASILVFPYILRCFSLTTDTVDLLPIYLFLFVVISEQFLIPFEKIMLTEEHPLTLILFNCCYLVLLCAVLTYTPSRLFLIVATVAMRIITAGALIFICYRKLGLLPTVPMHTAASLVTFLAVAITQLLGAA